MSDKDLASLHRTLGLQALCRFGCGEKLTNYFSSSGTFSVPASVALTSQAVDSGSRSLLSAPWAVEGGGLVPAL